MRKQKNMLTENDKLKDIVDKEIEDYFSNLSYEEKLKFLLKVNKKQHNSNKVNRREIERNEEESYRRF